MNDPLQDAGHRGVFVSRTRGAYWRKPYPASVVVWSAVLIKMAATLLGAWCLGLVAPIGWMDIGLIWGCSALWSVRTDAARRTVHRHLDHGARRHRDFVRLLKRRAPPSPHA